MLLSIASCRDKGTTGQKAKTVMLMDSVYRSEKNITILGPKDTIRLIESMVNFEDNPNITGADIDAGKNVSSAEIEYVRPGDTIRLLESDVKKRY